MQPLGMTGMKKVGDVFTDRKVPVRERGKVPVFEDAAGQIVWLAGFGIAHGPRVRDGSTTFLYLQAEER